jgi:glyoxylase-like metal-dependent hydrolase (beta-lactamase superfamily II)
MCPICGPLFGQKGLYAKVVCHCLLLETDQGLVLVDTGLGIQDYLHTQARLGRMVSRLGRIEKNLELTAIDQIQRLGFNPKDVKHILISHLDFDHAGGISDFPHATVHVLSSEFNATQSFFPLKNKARYKTQQFKQHRYWNFIEPNQGEAWFNLHQVQGFRLFQDEILMIPLLGHSQGHCGVAIKQHDGWLFFCGDAYYSHLQLDPKNRLPTLDKLERFFAEDNYMRVDNLHKIQQLAQNEKNIEIICAHDPVELERYQT